MAYNLDYDKREPLTYSLMSLLLNCPRAYYYRTVLGYERRKTETLELGTAFHKGIEEGSPSAAVDYLEEEANIYDQYQQNELIVLKAIAHGMVAGALKYWDHESEESIPEGEFAIPIINPASGHPSRKYYLTGKWDEVKKVDGRWRLTEYKTMGQTPNEAFADKLLLDTQITLYWYAAQRYNDIDIEEIQYRVARKPSIRQRKDETIRDYASRIIEDYRLRPEFYFYEETIYRTSEDLEEFERHLWSTVQLLNTLERGEFWPQNTSRCHLWYGKACDYMPLCLQEEDAKYLYEQSGDRTPELEGEMF